MTIALVAKKAGVSPATVSRVINRRPGVSRDIANAVRDAIEQLGYQPPPLEHRQGRRRPLVRREVGGFIAAVFLDNLYQHTPGCFLTTLRGMEAEAADHGIRLSVQHAADSGLSKLALSDRRIEGLVLIGSNPSPGIARIIERLPHVWVTSHHDEAGDIVLPGNQQIARIAAEYLAGRGHSRLAFIAVMTEYPAYPARAQAFRFAASQLGATVSVFLDDPRPAPEFDMPPLHDLRARMDALIDQMLAASPRPTGIFVGHDFMAALCYVSLRARGIEPGRDVDVIGCNNEVAYLFGLDPLPATIDIGTEQMGRRSVEQLLRRIRRPDETREVHIAVSPVLVPGGTGAGGRWS